MFSRTLKIHAGNRYKGLNKGISLWFNPFHETRIKSRSYSTSEKVIKWAKYSDELSTLAIANMRLVCFSLHSVPLLHK